MRAWLTIQFTGEPWLLYYCWLTWAAQNDRKVMTLQDYDYPIVVKQSANGYVPDAGSYSEYASDGLKAIQEFVMKMEPQTRIMKLTGPEYNQEDANRSLATEAIHNLEVKDLPQGALLAVRNDLMMSVSYDWWLESMQQL